MACSKSKCQKKKIHLHSFSDQTQFSSQLLNCRLEYTEDCENESDVLLKVEKIKTVNGFLA